MARRSVSRRSSPHAAAHPLPLATPLLPALPRSTPCSLPRGAPRSVSAASASRTEMPHRHLHSPHTPPTHLRETPLPLLPPLYPPTTPLPLRGPGSLVTPPLCRRRRPDVEAMLAELKAGSDFAQMDGVGDGNKARASPRTPLRRSSVVASLLLSSLGGPVHGEHEARRRGRRHGRECRASAPVPAEAGGHILTAPGAAGSTLPPTPPLPSLAGRGTRGAPRKARAAACRAAAAAAASAASTSAACRTRCTSRRLGRGRSGQRNELRSDGPGNDLRRCGAARCCRLLGRRRQQRELLESRHFCPRAAPRAAPHAAAATGACG